jgi:hypothetical protein
MPPSGVGRGLKPPPHAKTLAPSSITAEYIESLSLAPSGICALEQLRDECRASGKYLEAQVAAERVEQAKQELEQERMGVSEICLRGTPAIPTAAMTCKCTLGQKQAFDLGAVSGPCDVPSQLLVKHT